MRYEATRIIAFLLGTVLAAPVVCGSPWTRHTLRATPDRRTLAPQQPMLEGCAPLTRFASYELVKRGIGPRAPVDVLWRTNGAVAVLDNFKGQVYVHATPDANNLDVVPVAQPLLYPQALVERHGRLLASDERGIVPLEPREHERVVRPFLRIGDFDALPDGGFVLSAKAPPAGGVPSLGVLTVIDSAGVIKERKSLPSISNQGDTAAFIAANAERIVAVLKYFPLLLVFGDSGAPIQVQLRYPHGVDQIREAWIHDDRNRMTQCVSGLALVRNRVFVLLALARLTVLQYDDRGIYLGCLDSPEPSGPDAAVPMTFAVRLAGREVQVVAVLSLLGSTNKTLTYWRARDPFGRALRK